MADWTCDANKNRANKAKHGIGFELAQLVFEDPLSVTRYELDYEGDERWQTVGIVGPALLSVVHTLPEDQKSGRIISARSVSRQERKAYEEGEF